MEEKGRAAAFTLDDFKEKLTSLIKPGIMQRLIGMMTGIDELKSIMGDDPEGHARRLIGIINSMTVAERRNPTLIDSSRRNRIAQGSGTQSQEVTQLVRQFEFMAPIMNAMAGKGLAGRSQAIQDLVRFGRT